MLHYDKIKPVVPLSFVTLTSKSILSKSRESQSYYHCEKVFSICVLIWLVSRRWKDDNKRLCAMEPHLWLGRLHLKWDSNPELLDVGQHLTNKATGSCHIVNFCTLTFKPNICKEFYKGNSLQIIGLTVKVHG